MPSRPVVGEGRWPACRLGDLSTATVARRPAHDGHGLTAGQADGDRILSPGKAVVAIEGAAEPRDLDPDRGIEAGIEIRSPAKDLLGDRGQAQALLPVRQRLSDQEAQKAPAA